MAIAIRPKCSAVGYFFSEMDVRDLSNTQSEIKLFFFIILYSAFSLISILFSSDAFSGPGGVGASSSSGASASK
jgi:hypothetical protein